MKKRIIVSLALLVGVLFYLLFAPTPIEPIAWESPSAPSLTGSYEENSELKNISVYPMPKGAYGPESIAINSTGKAITADSTGQLFKIILTDDKYYEFIPWIKLDGRPLGVEFDQEENLIIADAIAGLVSVSPEGNVTTLSDSYEGKPYGFVDDLAIASDGTIYFSDATLRNWLAENPSLAMHASQYEILEHRGNGRLFAYFPDTQEVTLLLDNLQFANGVALSAEEDFVLVNETGSYLVRRYWLKGEKAGSSDIFINNLPGFPDNITTAPDGGFWIALIKPRNKVVDSLSEYPQMRKVASRLPQALMPVGAPFSHVVKVNAAGKVVKSLQDASATLENVTSAVEYEGHLFLGSLTDSKMGIYNLAQESSSN